MNFYLKLNLFTFLIYSSLAFSQTSADGDSKSISVVTANHDVIEHIQELRSLTASFLPHFLSSYFVGNPNIYNLSGVYVDNSKNKAFTLDETQGVRTYVLKPELVDQLIKATIILINPEFEKKQNLSLEEFPIIKKYNEVRSFLRKFLNTIQTTAQFYHNGLYEYREYRDSIKSQFLYKILTNKQGLNISEFKFYLISLYNPNPKSLIDQAYEQKSKFGLGSYLSDLSNENLINLYTEKYELRKNILKLVDSIYPIYELNEKYMGNELKILSAPSVSLIETDSNNTSLTPEKYYYRDSDSIEKILHSLLNSFLIINSYGSRSDITNLFETIKSFQVKARELLTMVYKMKPALEIINQLIEMKKIVESLEIARALIIDLREKNILEAQKKTKIERATTNSGQKELNLKNDLMKKTYSILLTKPKESNSHSKIRGFTQEEIKIQQSVRAAIEKILNKKYDESRKQNEIKRLLIQTFKEDKMTDFYVLTKLLMTNNNNANQTTGNNLKIKAQSNSRKSTVFNSTVTNSLPISCSKIFK